ncbi:unnamed protein product, partial [Ectocarpus sp. 12 AP-2014]
KTDADKTTNEWRCSETDLSTSTEDVGITPPLSLRDPPGPGRGTSPGLGSYTSHVNLRQREKG